MGKQRLEAFSDGVIAIIITVMVLEMKVPQGADRAALRPLLYPTRPPTCETVRPKRVIARKIVV